MPEFKKAIPAAIPNIANTGRIDEIMMLYPILAFATELSELVESATHA